MAAPAFKNPVFQDPRAVQSYPGGPQAASLGGVPQTAQATGMGLDAAQQAQLEGAYAAPAAGARETDRMTVEDTVIKTVFLFAALVVTAVIGWVWTLGGVLNPDQAVSLNVLPMLAGALIGFVLGLVNSFKKNPSAPLIFAYAAFEGLFVGGISAFFERMYPGIVVQATLATIAVVGVTLALFASGKVRASKRMTKIFMIAMVGYLVFSLLNVVLMWTNVLPPDMAFGMRSARIMGIPIGLIIGILVVFMAAYSLVLDFDMIQRGVRNGAPRKFGWAGGFGIMLTVVWLYLEILRILAILRGD